MAMALNPHVMRKIQKEIDEEVGRDRMPTFQDRPNLPLVAAVMKVRPIFAKVYPPNDTHRR